MPRRGDYTRGLFNSNPPLVMDLLVLLLILASVGYAFQVRDERRRVALLATYLGHYQIEKLMATLTDGYMRALGEPDLARQEQIWSMLSTTESALSEQFNRFVADFARVDGANARVSKLPLSIFYTGRLFPARTFDVRQALGIHAHGIARAVANGQQCSAKDKAFTLLAEVYLMQHTCHWFCKSRAVASARLVLRHQTPYAKVLESVSDDTRQAYCALTAR
jgi:hypothetical protein